MGYFFAKIKSPFDTIFESKSSITRDSESSVYKNI